MSEEAKTASDTRRSPWCGEIERIQREALLGPAVDSSDAVLDRLSDVRDLRVVELAVCTDLMLHAEVAFFHQVKLVYRERVRRSSKEVLARPLVDVADHLLLRARDYSLAFSPGSEDIRFLIVATGASSISMMRIEPSTVSRG